MHDSLKKVRFSIKPSMIEKGRSLELARTLPVHPLTYQELPFDPEYSQYAGRLTTEKLSNATPDEMYWKTRQELILRHTGEYPYEVSGPDALKLLQKIFPRDISKVNVGRCSYQFACYHDGGMITDGLLLRIEENKFWFAQADGDLFSWYKANAHGLNVNITDPDVWVSQVQGPKSMELLDHLIDEDIAKTWKYFDWTTVTIKGEKLIISRTGFTNELGWELYLRPENNAELIGDLILEEGKKMGMIITATPSFRGRRIEAGLLSAGQDFTKDTNPFSVGLGRFVDLEKKDFIGKSALINSDKKCKTWGIRVVEGVAKKGETISLNNKIIGNALYCSAVPNSAIFIWKSPSPAKQMTVLLGLVIFAEIAAGRPNPIAPLVGANNLAFLPNLNRRLLQVEKLPAPFVNITSSGSLSWR